jgi:hypothetical protein
MIITKDSHLDHGLDARHIEWLLATFGDREGFHAETLDIPEGLADASTALYGAAAGDEPVPDDAVIMRVRGVRPGASRMIEKDPRPSRKLTVIMGPKDGQTILYTAHGGPLAPREPFDPSLDDKGREESIAFWAQHALADGEPVPF